MGEMPPGIQLHGSGFRVCRRVRGTWIVRSFETLEQAEEHLRVLAQGTADRRAVLSVRASGALTVMEIVRLWWLGPIIDGEHRDEHRVRVAGVTQRNYQYYIDAYISRIGTESGTVRRAQRRPSEALLRLASEPLRVARPRRAAHGLPGCGNTRARRPEPVHGRQASCSETPETTRPLADRGRQDRDGCGTGRLRSCT